MKILMVNKFLYPNGGSETYFFQLGDYLTKKGHEVQYFGMEHPNRCVENELQCYTSNMDFHAGGFGKLLYPFKIIYSSEAKKKMERVLTNFKPDIIHINNFNFQLTPSILYAIKNYRKRCCQTAKIIYTAHDSQLVCPNHLMFNPTLQDVCKRCLKGSCYNCLRYKCTHGSTAKSMIAMIEGYFYRFLHTYKLIDVIISPSEFMKQCLESQPDLRDKIVVIRNFLELKQAAVSEKKDYVLYFGRYSSEKGIDFLLEVCKEISDIPFIFAGACTLEEKVNIVSNRENVGFKTGDDLKDYIASDRFSLRTSICYENCQLSNVESQ